MTNKWRSEGNIPHGGNYSPPKRWSSEEILARRRSQRSSLYMERRIIMEDDVGSEECLRKNSGHYGSGLEIHEMETDDTDVFEPESLDNQVPLNDEMINAVFYSLPETEYTTGVVDFFAIEIGQLETLMQLKKSGETRMKVIMHRLLQAWRRSNQPGFEATGHRAINLFCKFPELVTCVNVLRKAVQ